MRYGLTWTRTTRTPLERRRQWSLIIGGSMVLMVVCTPKFTKFRIVAIIGEQKRGRSCAGAVLRWPWS